MRKTVIPNPECNLSEAEKKTYQENKQKAINTLNHKANLTGCFTLFNFKKCNVTEPQDFIPFF